MHFHHYLGVGGHIVCIDERNGGEVWRTKLRTTDVVSISIGTTNLVVYAKGHLFGIHRGTGAILWVNELPGLGYSYCTIATQGAERTGGQDGVAFAAAANAARQSSSSSG